MKLNPNASEFIPGQFSSFSGSNNNPTFNRPPQQQPPPQAAARGPVSPRSNFPPPSWEDEDAVPPPITTTAAKPAAGNTAVKKPAPANANTGKPPAQPQQKGGAPQPAAKGAQPAAKGGNPPAKTGAQPAAKPAANPVKAETKVEAKPEPANPVKVETKVEAKPEPAKQEAKIELSVKSEPEDYDEEDDEEDVPKVIADDPREHLNIVFIGHVDAGKSTISGNILYLTGQVDARTIEKYEIEAKNKNRTSWFLAYIMDTNEEERAKGKTVEVGRAHFVTAKKRYTILDAPGHKNYVPNMISGVAQADIAILVISARKGEFEAGFDRSGQTREHALLAKTLGVKKLVIAINKMDEPTVGWSEERFSFIKKNFNEWLQRDRIFPPKDVEWIPISGFDGSNMLKGVSSSVCPWYQGPPLLELLDTLQPLARLDTAPLRIPVLDRYKESGKLVILGKIEAGVLRTGDTVCVVPGGHTFVINQIENDAGTLTVAKPGENIRLIVKSGLDEEALTRGSVICPVESAPIATTDFVGQIQILELLEHKSLFSAGYECVLHVHTAVEEVSITLLLEKLNPKTGKPESKLPKFVQSKDFVVAHLTTTRPVPIEKFDEFAQLGRFTLRDEGKTIAVGKILATNAPIKRKKEKPT
jgi:peptide chain release factor subunit 3